MGVVYKARDTHLDRFAAIKVPPDVFAGDPERLARHLRTKDGRPCFDRLDAER
jgi:hypothetical protein